MDSFERKCFIGYEKHNFMLHFWLLKFCLLSVLHFSKTCVLGYTYNQTTPKTRQEHVENWQIAMNGPGCVMFALLTIQSFYTCPRVCKLCIFEAYVPARQRSTLNVIGTSPTCLEKE